MKEKQFLPLPEEGKQYTASELCDVLLAAASQDTLIDNIYHSSEARTRCQHGAEPDESGV